MGARERDFMVVIRARLAFEFMENIKSVCSYILFSFLEHAFARKTA